MSTDARILKPVFKQMCRRLSFCRTSFAVILWRRAGRNLMTVKQVLSTAHMPARAKQLAALPVIAAIG